MDKNSEMEIIYTVAFMNNSPTKNQGNASLLTQFTIVDIYQLSGDQLPLMVVAPSHQFSRTRCKA